MGQVFVLVRDPKGKVIAVVDNNTWKIFSDEYEYNNDEKALELVTAGERIVYFQIEFKDGIVHLRGAMVDSNGAGIYFYDEGEKGLIQRTDNAMPPKLPSGAYELLFKYPREKYLGLGDKIGVKWYIVTKRKAP